MAERETWCMNCKGIIYWKNGCWFHRGSDRVLCPPMEATPIPSEPEPADSTPARKDE